MPAKTFAACVEEVHSYLNSDREMIFALAALGDLGGIPDPDEIPTVSKDELSIPFPHDGEMRVYTAKQVNFEQKISLQVFVPELVRYTTLPELAKMYERVKNTKGIPAQDVVLGTIIQKMLLITSGNSPVSN